MEVIDSDERVTKRMSKKWWEREREAGGVMVVENQTQPKSEGLQKGKLKSRHNGRRHAVGSGGWVWWNPWEITMMRSAPAGAQEQAADWLQIGFRGWAN